MHERISVHQICLMSVSNKEFVSHCRNLGAHRISLISRPLLSGDGVSSVKEALSAGDCRIETITHVFLPGEHLHRNEASWQEARGRLSHAIKAAEALGARSIYMLTGGHGTLTWEEAAENFSEAIAPCVREAKGAGIELMIENAPFLYADSHIAHTLHDTVLLAEMAEIGVCIDIFSCWAEAGLRDLIERAMPRCHLIQVSDYVYGDKSLPARAVPGDGTIPLQQILGWALEAGYEGAFDLELIGPRIEEEGCLESIRRSGENVGKILQSLGV